MGADVVQLPVNPRCFVTGEDLPIPETRAKANVMGQIVVIGQEGKRLLAEYLAKGDIEVLPETGPARSFIATIVSIHTNEQILQALDWLAKFEGARLEFQATKVTATIFTVDGQPVEAQGPNIIDAVGRLSESVLVAVSGIAPPGQPS